MDQVPYLPASVEFDFSLVHRLETSKEYLALVSSKMKAVLDHALLVAKQASRKEDFYLKQITSLNSELRRQEERVKQLKSELAAVKESSEHEVTASQTRLQKVEQQLQEQRESCKSLRDQMGPYRKMNQMQEEMIQDLIVAYKKRVNQVALDLVTRAQDTLLFIKNPASLGQTLDIQKSQTITREQLEEMLRT